MIIPPKLKFGDKIGFISTARKISLEELNPAIRIMHSWGLEVVLGKFLFGEYNQFSKARRRLARVYYVCYYKV